MLLVRSGVRSGFRDLRSGGGSGSTVRARRNSFNCGVDNQERSVVSDAGGTRSGSLATLQQQTERLLPALVYSPEYSFRGWDPKHRFVMDKFRHLHELLAREPLFARSDSFITPEDPAVLSGAAKRLERSQGFDFTGAAVQAIDQHWLGLAHEPEYVKGFCEGTIPMRRIGLPWSQALVRRTRLEVAGTILTARLALEHGLACNLAGGTHHAHYGEGSGFTIFNDLVVAALVLLDEFNTTSSTAVPSRKVPTLCNIDL
jgi:hypothetical protein